MGKSTVIKEWSEWGNNMVVIATVAIVGSPRSCYNPIHVATWYYYCVYNEDISKLTTIQGKTCFYGAGVNLRDNIICTIRLLLYSV